MKNIINYLKKLFGKNDNVTSAEHLNEYKQYKLGDYVFRVSDVYLTIEQFEITDIRRVDGDDEVWITVSSIENNEITDIFVGSDYSLDGQSNCWFTWYSNLDNMESGVRSSIQYAEHANLQTGFEEQLSFYRTKLDWNTNKQKVKMKVIYLEDEELIDAGLRCPFCGEPVLICVCDDEGNLHELEYENDPYSGLGYVLVHWTEVTCPIASFDGETLGREIYDTIEEAVNAWTCKHPTNKKGK